MANILVMDDDPMTRQFFRDVLEKLLHHTVNDAGRIDEALELTRRVSFEVMFLDRNLPDGTALEFCQTLAQFPSGSDTPKWIITGEKPLEWDADMWLRLGVRGYSIKPFRIDWIKKVLDQCLQQTSE